MHPSFKQIKSCEEIKTYIRQADASLSALGYTEHSFAHVTKCAVTAGYILEQLGYSDDEIELAKIAAYMHDIGNVINRQDHAQSGAVMAFRILDKMGMEAQHTAAVITAIGNHDEATAFPVNAIAAAVILADKCDVRRTRVREKESIDIDIHDRVNYSVTKATISVSKEHPDLVLTLEIDTKISTVSDYFEIFLTRMLLCRKAAAFFGKQFTLVINGQKLM